MSIFSKWKDYIPSSRRGASAEKAAYDDVHAAATISDSARADAPKDDGTDVPEEELRENLNLTAQPEGTTSFNRRNVLIGLSLVGVLFTGAFIYGISTASNAQKHKNAESTVEAATQTKHLQNAPTGYDDEKSKRYDKKQETKDEKPRDEHKVSRLHDDGSVEYARSAQRSVPAYTPVPQVRPSVQTPVPRVTAPASAAAKPSGLTPEQKIAAEKAKEKMAANQSPIGFALKEEGK